MIKSQVSVADKKIIFNIFDDEKDYKDGLIHIRCGHLASLEFEYSNSNIVYDKFLADIIILLSDIVIDAKKIKKLIPNSCSLTWETSPVEGSTIRRLASTGDVKCIFKSSGGFNSVASENEILNEKKKIEYLINYIFG